MKTIYDQKNSYIATFDEESGFSARSGILTEDGTETEIDPFGASFPELLDIGIMGHCKHGLSGLCLQSGVECYQSGSEINAPNMSFENFKAIIDEIKGRTFQIALGGRGDPDQHEDFIKILQYSSENGVVPNFTTSGLGLHKIHLPAIKRFCGAVAVSYYRNEYTDKAIEMLTDYGIKTNIHYVLSKSTIKEAIEILSSKRYFDRINRIIFLLHKPVGLGTVHNMLSVENPDVAEFFKYIGIPEIAEKCGFDSCSVPALLNFTENLLPESIEPCEAARFSAYISPDFKLYPCSFEQDPKQSVDLSTFSLEAAWNSETFNDFRKRFERRCTSCTNYPLCYGGCPVIPEITICKQLNDERRGYIENKN
jgi:radical SAM protein with 4Fe4S-binding SPASM domain